VALSIGSIAAGSAASLAPDARPDGLIRRPSQQAYGGNDIYNLSGAGQRRSARVEPGRTAYFYVRVQNDGDRADDIRLWGSSESNAFAVRYYLGSNQVAPRVKAGTFVLHDLRPGGYRTLTVQVQARRDAPRGSRREVVLSSRSASDGKIRDNVAMDVSVPLYTPDQRRVAELIGQSRRQHGRGSLLMERQLNRKAQSWAAYLASVGRLAHSDLRSGVPSGWRSLAENVGMGASISDVHARFMASGGHRSNILGGFNFVGTGVARGHGRVWVVQVFMLR
jgi:uncharacterized protein YkwD